MSRDRDNEQTAYLLQELLIDRGAVLVRDGWAGARTRAALVAWAGHPHLRHFRGDLDWLHAREAHGAAMYWPGGNSGPTVNPGLDLGHADRETIEAAVEALGWPEMPGTWEEAIGLRGQAAKDYVQRWADIAPPIGRLEAALILPVIARPYWSAACERWPSLAGAPPPVQTALLSLCYSRGAGNRHLEVVGPLLAAEDWPALADQVAGMQQHRDDGIPERRRLEAELIRSAT